MSEPQRIDRYEVRGILGHGAMGHVYLAWDPKLHREVALKVVSTNLTRDNKGRERFHREARAIAALKHPNIVEIYDYSGEESRDLYLVMERLDGDDLFNIMNDKGVTPEAGAAAVGHEICLALAVAHESGVIHRDIKPENVFMNDAGRVVLTDFGVVKAIREGSAVDGWSVETDVIGTPGFMAPELMMNRALGPRTDIFALGALLFNITTAEMPFAGESPVEIFRNVVASRMRDPRAFNSSLSDEFVEVLSGCLEAKPKKRFRSAELVRERLKVILELNGVTDLRDDLRDYMRDPPAYATRSRNRAVNYLVDKIKVAAKDRDEATERRLKKRLAAIDPGNRAIDEVSGVRVPREDPSIQAVRRPSRASSKRYVGGQWLYGVVGVLVTVAVLMAIYLAARPGGAPETTGVPENGNAAPVAEKTVAPVKKTAPAGSARVMLSIRGGPAVVFVDGKRVGRFRHKVLNLAAGKHLIEIRGGRKKLRRVVTLSAGGRTEVRADLRRGRVRVN